MFPPIQTFPEKGLLFFGKYFPGKKKVPGNVDGKEASVLSDFSDVIIPVFASDSNQMSGRNQKWFLHNT